MRVYNIADYRGGIEARSIGRRFLPNPCAPATLAQPPLPRRSSRPQPRASTLGSRGAKDRARQACCFVTIIRVGYLRCHHFSCRPDNVNGESPFSSCGRAGTNGVRGRVFKANIYHAGAVNIVLACATTGRRSFPLSPLSDIPEDLWTRGSRWCCGEIRRRISRRKQNRKGVRKGEC